MWSGSNISNPGKNIDDDDDNYHDVNDVKDNDNDDDDDDEKAEVPWPTSALRRKSRRHSDHSYLHDDQFLHWLPK